MLEIQLESQGTMKFLMECTSQDIHKKAFSTLLDADKEVIRADAAEQYLSYIFLRQSAN